MRRRVLLSLLILAVFGVVFVVVRGGGGRDTNRVPVGVDTEIEDLTIDLGNVSLPEDDLELGPGPAPLPLN